jgi:hypothetical protein
MASCERYEETLWEAAETGVITADLQQHLDACQACRENLASLQGAITGFAKLRQMPDHVPVVILAPLLPATRWWPRAAFAGVIVMLAIAGISLWFMRKQPESVVKIPPKPSVQPEQPKPAPVIVEEPKEEEMPRVTRAVSVTARQRRVVRKIRLPEPVPAPREESAPEPELLPVPEYDPVEMLISAQPVNGLVPLDAVPLNAQALTAVSDLPLTYALMPVTQEEIPRLLDPAAPPEDGRSSGEDAVEKASLRQAAANAS